MAGEIDQEVVTGWEVATWRSLALSHAGEEFSQRGTGIMPPVVYALPPHENTMPGPEPLEQCAR